MIGTRLAQYEITGHLGSGGMGDVYQATDTKLGRSVAIKVLPELVAADADRIARFEREARALAALNHPHIAAIYGLEHAAGRQFLVMELVGGDTLAARIARGPLPLDDSLRIAAQIADALDTAHDRGIVHRDLKPANIKVTVDGQVKVLDFGLAKAIDPTASAVGVTPSMLSQSPTLSVAATGAGFILGTAAYMSPEQAKGAPVDRRTDIFAFGCVLYEMLAGRAAFAGDGATEILASVIKSEPDWSALPADTPLAVRRLLRRCLQKDRTRRLQNAGDVRLEIEEARAEPEPPAQAVAAPAAARHSWIGWGVAATLGIALAGALAFLFIRTPAAAPELRVDIVTPSSPDPISFALSPDGRRLTFAALQDRVDRLWLRPLDTAVAQPIPGTDGATYPFWSPDSRSIGFFAGGKLKRVDTGGGAPQTLADAPSGRGGAWLPDGTIVFSPAGGSPLLKVAAAGGQSAPFSKLEGQTSHRFPHVLPDARHILLYVAGGQTSAVQGIYLASIDGSQPKRLVASDCAGTYLPSGWLLFVRQGTLVAQRLNVDAGALTGEPVTVADPIAVDQAVNVCAVSASDVGPMTYRAGGTDKHQLQWFDRAGKPLGTMNAPDEAALLDPELSPDGRRVVANRTVQGNTDIWLIDGARTSRLTFDAATDHWPTWSPDGKWIAFDSTRKGSHDLYMKPANGEADEQLLLADAEGKGVMDWSPDGRYLMYTSQGPVTAFDLWVLDMNGDRTPQVFLKTRFDETNGQFSPDGRWVAYQSNESGQYQIYVRPFPGPGGQWQISTAGGVSPRWRHDGRELYYLTPDGRLIATPVEARSASVEPGAPVPLFQTRILSSALRPQFDVAADGRFLLNAPVESAAVAPITLVLNWKPPAK